METKIIFVYAYTLVLLIERVEEWAEEEGGTRPNCGYPLQNGPRERWL